MNFAIRKRSGRMIEVRPEYEQVGDKIIGSTLWTDAAGTRQERYQVITVRDGKIVDMQGFRSRREALRFAPPPEIENPRVSEGFR